jgi:hypothetical protein
VCVVILQKEVSILSYERNIRVAVNPVEDGCFSEVLILQRPFCGRVKKQKPVNKATLENCMSSQNNLSKVCFF